MRSAGVDELDISDIDADGSAGGRFGTQHSATGESWYMAQPGMHVALAGTPQAAYGLISAAVKSNDPVIVHEPIDSGILRGRPSLPWRGPVRSPPSGVVLKRAPPDGRLADRPGYAVGSRGRTSSASRRSVS